MLNSSTSDFYFSLQFALNFLLFLESHNMCLFQMNSTLIIRWGWENFKFYSIKLCTTSEAYLIDVFRVFVMVDV